MEVVLNRNSCAMRLALVYRPSHPGTEHLFFDEFDSFIELFSSKHEKLLICGDFNFWVDDPLHKPYSSDFVDFLDSNNLVNYVLTPTHPSGHILDLVLSPAGSSDVKDVNVIPCDPSVSDHALITFNFMIPKPSTHEKIIKFRCYSNVDQNLVCCEIDQHLRTNTDISEFSSDELVQRYNDALGLVFNRHCPEVEKRIVVRDDTPWYNTSIKFLRRERRKAERRWRNNKTEFTRSLYALARRAVVNAIKEEKKKYYQRKIDACGNDQKKLFTVVSKLTGKKAGDVRPSSESDLALASDFAVFFSSKITGIRNELDRFFSDGEFSVEPQPQPNPNGILSSFHLVDVDTVLSHIRTLNKTSCLLDPIHTSRMCSVYVHTVSYITTIINKCFLEGSFPKSEKRALIRPLLKKPGIDTESLSNYRPVSNLSFLSKILERAILDQLTSLLQQNDTIPVVQSAYRKHHSTETALTKIHNDLVENTCMGMSSLLVLLDLSAAFDTVDHEILLSDLYNCGVRDSALMLLRSYLLGRSQCVLVNQTVSDSVPLLYGVPQGSVLGPVLFTIYTSSLSSLFQSHNVDYHFYADDTQIYLKITNIEDAKRKIDLLILDIKIWMTRRKLKLNDQKTEFIIVRGRRRLDADENEFVINLGDSQLPPVGSVRNLGVYINSRLDYKEHINSIVKSCCLHIRNLYRVKHFVNERCLLMLVHAMIFSRVDYCNALLVGIPNYLLKKLQSILNKAARLCLSIPPRTPTTSYLIALHWLPIRARLEFKLCLLTFKVLKFGEPRYLAELLQCPPVRSGVALRHDDDPLRLHEPGAAQQSLFSERSFAYVAPRLYNRLPLSMRQLSSVEGFKKQLKTFLFEKSYDLQGCILTDDYTI